MAKKTSGDIPLSQSLNMQKAAPVDDRMTVQYLTDLTGSTLAGHYKGMKVEVCDESVLNKNATYTLMDVAYKNEISNRGWKQEGANTYLQVGTYAALLAITAPSILLTVKVASDENKNLGNTIYQLWPDGTRMWVTAIIDTGGQMSFKSVATYALMIADGTPSVAILYIVIADENKSYTRSTYLWKPNGNREWVASTPG